MAVVNVWVVEAVDSKGRAIWREIFSSEMNVESCYKAALADPTVANVHRWQM